MKKLSTLVLLFSIFLLSCTSPSKKQGDKTVFVSILPLKYFVNKIAGEHYRVEVMVPPGVGPETYSPTPKQMKRLGEAEAYFAIGYLGFEVDLLGKFSSLNPNLKVINVSEGINLIREKEEKHEDHYHIEGVDPHIWSSPKEAVLIARNVYNGLIAIDPANKDDYSKNLGNLLLEINKVDSTITRILTGIPERKFIIFHPALTYLARDYGLEQFSIEFEGKVPSPKHLQELVSEARSQNIRVVLIQKEFDRRNAEIIAQEIGGKMIQIDPLDENWPGQMISIATAIAGNPPNH